MSESWVGHASGISPGRRQWAAEHPGTALTEPSRPDGTPVVCTGPNLAGASSNDVGAGDQLPGRCKAHDGHRKSHQPARTHRPKPPADAALRRHGQAGTLRAPSAITFAVVTRRPWREKNTTATWNTITAPVLVAAPSAARAAL